MESCAHAAAPAVRAPFRQNPSEGDWEDDHGWDGAPDLTVDVTDNPVVATLYGPDGRPLLELLEREPIGFRIR